MPTDPPVQISRIQGPEVKDRDFVAELDPEYLRFLHAHGLPTLADLESVEKVLQRPGSWGHGSDGVLHYNRWLSGASTDGVAAPRALERVKRLYFYVCAQPVGKGRLFAYLWGYYQESSTRSGAY